MKWRIDKPTANLIVAEIGFGKSVAYYDVLARLGSGAYMGKDGVEPFSHILRWADLEEDEKERQDKPIAHEGSWTGINTISSQDKDMNIEEIAQQYVDNVKTLYNTPTWDFVHTAVIYGYQYVKDIMEEDER